MTSGEKAQYDNEVDVYFQEYARMDEDINIQWLNVALIPGIGNEPDEKVIFADNVEFQQTGAGRSYMRHTERRTMH